MTFHDTDMSLICRRIPIRNYPSCSRQLFSWVNDQFNDINEDRRKLYGPDRVCAEWLLRNGAAVKWLDEREFLRDYNKLPHENFRKYIQEVDATKSSINDYGFRHFDGLKSCRKVILDKCYFLGDDCLKELLNVKDVLTHLQITNVPGISDGGLLHLINLHRLKELSLAYLPNVHNKDDLVKVLKDSLPKCKIVFD